jgi:hypothetical protein
MMSNERIEELQTRHAKLENELVAETSRPQPDSSAVAELKRQKLAIKDELTAVEETTH